MEEKDENPQDLFPFLNQVALLESDAVEKIKNFAQKARDLGLEEAAREFESAAED